jgi:DNA polymerase III subunit epsilon
MKEDAIMYYDKFKFNVTILSNKRNKFNFNKNIYKHPCHEWEYLSIRRQKRHDLTKASWKNVHGIGTVLEFNKLRALDIDDCNDDNFIRQLLSLLGLPNDYEWTVRSGSHNGYHVLFYANDNKLSDFESLRIAYAGKGPYKSVFRKIEFRWKSHLVLPPSVHRSGGRYEFLNEFPKSAPVFVKMSNVISVIEKFCLITYNKVDNMIPSTVSPAYSYSSEEESSEEERDSSEEEEEDASEEEEGDSSEEEKDIESSENEEAEGEESSEDEEGETDEENEEEGEDDEEDDKDINRVDDSVKKRDFTNIKYYLFLDTETTGLPKKGRFSVKDLDNWPRIVQVAWILSDSRGNIISNAGHIVKPNGFIIPDESIEIHGISNIKAITSGHSVYAVLKELLMVVNMADCIVAHNMEFDEKTVWSEFHRLKNQNPFRDKLRICTMEGSANFCKIKSNYGYKWPTLGELYYKLFQTQFQEVHNAEYDIQATFKCFWELKRLGKI